MSLHKLFRWLLGDVFDKFVELHQLDLVDFISACSLTDSKVISAVTFLLHYTKKKSQKLQVDDRLMLE